MDTKRTTKTTRRAMPRAVRREQLIKATINCIAEMGLSATTMAQVTREAGLSLGIVNLHFKSKDLLLADTLRYVADEYNAGLDAILEQSSQRSLAETLEALLDFDFSAQVTQKKKLAVWFAFWGEAKSRPTYQKICATSDIATADTFRRLFTETIAEGDYSDINADLLATGYTSLAAGLWLDLLVAPRQLNRSRARRIASDYLHNAFPEHVRRS